MSHVKLDELDHLADLFDRLRSGRHICADDGPLYLSLRAAHPAYKAVFTALGFDLVEHDRGFYYFRSSDELGKEATQLAVFFFVLVEAWGDLGQDIESSAFDPAGHALAALPHWSRESWRVCMQESGVSSEEDLTKVVQRLDRLGFTEKLSEDRFRFRSPAWRFFDLCRALQDEAETAEAEAAEVSADEERAP